MTIFTELLNPHPIQARWSSAETNAQGAKAFFAASERKHGLPAAAAVNAPACTKLADHVAITIPRAVAALDATADIAIVATFTCATSDAASSSVARARKTASPAAPTRQLVRIRRTAEPTTADIGLDDASTASTSR